MHMEPYYRLYLCHYVLISMTHFEASRLALKWLVSFEVGQKLRIGL